jgi:hypothetical protein
LLLFSAKLLIFWVIFAVVAVVLVFVATSFFSSFICVAGCLFSIVDKVFIKFYYKNMSISFNLN